MPPPYGGVNVWTANFMRHAPTFGLQVLLEAVGPRHIAHAFVPWRRVARLGRGLALPLWHMHTRPHRDADVVHVCASGGPSFWRALALADLARRQGRRAVVHLHSRARTCHPVALGWMQLLARDPLVRCVTPSQEDSANIPALRHLPHFLEPPQRLWQGPRGPGLRAVYAGWMIREKGIFDLLEVLQRHPQAHLDAYGPNVRHTDLRAWETEVARRNLQQRVRYLGEVPHAKLAGVLAGYDALLWASHGESFGLVAAEAMQLGLPVVGRAVGFLQAAPAGTFIEGFALDALLHDKAATLNRVSACGRAYVLSQFAISETMRRWCEIYGMGSN